MKQLIAYGRADGLHQLDGVIFRDNQVMLALCRDLGFSIDAATAGQDVVRARLRLDPGE